MGVGVCLEASGFEMGGGLGQVTSGQTGEGRSKRTRGRLEGASGQVASRRAS